MNNIKDKLERCQVAIYFGAVVIAFVVAFICPAMVSMGKLIDGALAFMLFVTFLQVPLSKLGNALKKGRFLAALLAANFVAIPLLLLLLSQLLPSDPMIKFGVFLVLLCPCIDYVVTFSYFGRADSSLLLASTPALLLAQMILLPVFLGIFLGESTASLVSIAPFIRAFIWLIVIPLALAGLVQLWAAKKLLGEQVSTVFCLFPVPATALVLFVVIVSVVPQLKLATDAAISVAPVYILFALMAPLLGWGVGRLFRLEPLAGRAVAFSAGTRNSLVVLALALAVPGAIPVLPAIIVTQTLVELVSEMIYIRFIARLGER